MKIPKIALLKGEQGHNILCVCVLLVTLNWLYKKPICYQHNFFKHTNNIFALFTSSHFTPAGACYEGGI